MEKYFELFGNLNPMVLVIIIMPIIILIIATVVRVKGFDAKNNLSADMVWAKWFANSKIMKIEKFFIGLFSLAALFFAFSVISSYFLDELGIKLPIDFEKLFNFANMEENEIVAKLTRIFRVIIVIFSIAIVIFELLKLARMFEIARWLQTNKIDCYSILICNAKVCEK